MKLRMRMRKGFLVLACIGVVAVAVGGWAISVSQRAVPSSRSFNSTTSLASRPPYDPQFVRQMLEFWAKKAQSDPQGAIARATLAKWSLESYRETGDMADAKRAENAARASLKIRAKNNPDAPFQLSRSLVTQHRFQEALQFARRVALYNPEGYRQCADIELELGDYTAAQRDFAKVQPAETDPSYLALSARFHELKGRNQVQLALLQKAVLLADANRDMSPQSVAWFHERLGHCLASMGRFDKAEANYKVALQVFPRDYRTMAALAHLEANRNHWTPAIEWAKKAAAIVPAPETIALLGDAYAATGKTAEAKRQYALIEDMGKLERAQGVIYDRQRALFNVEHNRNLPEALTLARGELQMRHDIYAYDTLAWVLYKTGKLDEAQKAATQSLRQGTQDASLYFHAGIIANARRQRERAQKYLSQALKINPQFHPTAPKQARVLLSQLDTASASN